MRSLNVPLSVHEEATVRHVRGGRYAVRMVGSWMEIAKRLTGRRGDIQDQHEQVMSFLRRFIETLLATKKTGRTQLIEQLCTEAIAKKKHASILVENSREEAGSSQAHLEATIGQAAFQSTLLPVRWMVPPPESVHHELGNLCLPLFPARTPWLGLPSSRHIVLCHPYEQERVADTLRHWWLQHARASQVQGDKYHLWALQWVRNEFLTDRQSPDDSAEETPVMVTAKKFEGEYPKEARIVTIPSLRGHDDWLNALMTDPVRPSG